MLGPVLAEGRNVIIEGEGDDVLHDAGCLGPPATKLCRQLRRLHALMIRLTDWDRWSATAKAMLCSTKNPAKRVK